VSKQVQLSDLGAEHMWNAKMPAAGLAAACMAVVLMHAINAVAVSILLHLD
jgi:hypothetical protein